MHNSLLNQMKYYFAPMEGITGYVYRNAHSSFFENTDKYFAPFISLTQNSKGYRKELKDILPENNDGRVIIPQILTNQAGDFIKISRDIKELGYDEINLNLGCPSGTVVSKNKGAGFLAQKEDLDHFLEEVFSASITRISVKTRIGKDEPEEFYELIRIFNKYPMEELIIHPRIQKDYYKNKPNMEVFKEAFSSSKNPVCYNGDIFTMKDYRDFLNEFPNIESVMLGRGLLANPFFINQLRNEDTSWDSVVDKQVLKRFHDRVYKDYQEIMSGDRPVLFKMKEMWFYMAYIFSNHAQYAKKIRKAEKLWEYEKVVISLFDEEDIEEGAGFRPVL